MILIKHRVNSLEELSLLPASFGAEVDVRYHKDELILEHDPFAHDKKNLTTLKAFLRDWRSEGPLILNLKSEGLENTCIDLLDEFGVRNWFFLDLSMPYFVKYAKLAVSKQSRKFHSGNLAVRFSDCEPIEYAMAFAKKADWVWVDCFDGNPLSVEAFMSLKSKGFKLCLVSPELQNYDKEHLLKFKKKCDEAGFDIDAVCTKYPEVWFK